MHFLLKSWILWSLPLDAFASIISFFLTILIEFMNGKATCPWDVIAVATFSEYVEKVLISNIFQAFKLLRSLRLSRRVYRLSH